MGACRAFHVTTQGANGGQPNHELGDGHGDGHREIGNRRVLNSNKITRLSMFLSGHANCIQGEL
jgi:hypothetical protein